MPGTEWAIVAAVVATVVGLVVAYIGGRRGRDREAKLEGQLLERRIAELERELATRKDQRTAAGDAAAEVVEAEREVAGAGGVADPRDRHGVLLDDGPVGDRDPAGAPPGSTA